MGGGVFMSFCFRATVFETLETVSRLLRTLLALLRDSLETLARVFRAQSLSGESLREAAGLRHFSSTKIRRGESLLGPGPWTVNPFGCLCRLSAQG